MRIPLALKVGVLTTSLVLVVAGAVTYVLLFRLSAAQEQELVRRDRELVQVLAGLRDERGRLAFGTLTSFVRSSDRVDMGLVYCLELDRRGRLLQGALNPRLFGALDPDFQQRVRQAGRRQVLEALATKKIERKGLIKEYAVAIPQGQLRAGFDLRRIDSRIAKQRRAGLGILLVGLILGVVASLLLARWLTRPIRRLAAAMKAVAEGDLSQTVEVRSRDELASLAESFNQMMRSLRGAGVRGAGVQGDLPGTYLSERIWQRLKEADQPLAIKTQERVATVLSLHLEGFARVAARIPPREALSLANDYLAPILDILLDHQAVVFVVDDARLQVAWGAIDGVVDGEVMACQAARAVVEAVKDESRRKKTAGQPTVGVSMGLASGRVAVGNTGSSRRAAFRMVGLAVEQARRAEYVCEEGDVLLTETVLSRLGDGFQVEPFGALQEGDDEMPVYRLGPHS